VPVLGASGAIAAVLGAYFVLYPYSRVLTLVLVFPVKIAAWVFLGLWFLYQLVEANYGLLSASANGGGVAFFAHIGGFLFGLFVARAFLASRETARSRSESLSFGCRGGSGCVSAHGLGDEEQREEVAEPVETADDVRERGRGEDAADAPLLNSVRQPRPAVHRRAVVGQHHAKRVTTAHTRRCFSCGAMTDPAQTPTDPRPSQVAELAATRAREAART
jgi:hypothetical protein